MVIGSKSSVIFVGELDDLSKKFYGVFSVNQQGRIFFIKEQEVRKYIFCTIEQNLNINYDTNFTKFLSRYTRMCTQMYDDIDVTNLRD